MNLKKALLSSKGRVVSGQAIARELGISRTAVWKNIQQLKKQGFEIESIKKTGYILKNNPEIIDEEKLRNWLNRSGVRPFYGGLKYLNSTASTQIIAKKFADNPIIGSLIILAEKQEHSYGRLGREWHSPEGGLWFSLLLKPNLPPQKAAILTLVFSLAIRESLQKFSGVKIFVKWPNDIYAENRKIGGILTEISAELDRTRWLIIGAGININNTMPETLKNSAISLFELKKEKSYRSAVLIDILENFMKRYRLFSKQGFEIFRKEYIKNSIWVGRQIEVKTTDNSSHKGIYSGIDDNGFLILNSGGKKRAFPSGDIFRINSNTLGV